MTLDHQIPNHQLVDQTFLDASFATPAGMTRTQFHAMGTTVSLLLPEQQSEVAATLVQMLFAEWEQTLSRFLTESELSRLNERAGKPVVVGTILWKVLTTALQAARATKGIYDPTLLKQLVMLGYDRSFEILPSLPASTIEPVEMPGGGWRDIHLDHTTHEVTLPKGVALDFGGIAKGMAVDAAIVQLRQIGVRDALVNAGGDLVVTGLPSTMQDWPIAVQGKNRTWTIPLHHGAMATSGIAKRHWQQGQHQRHHLLDPRTGIPVRNGLWSVSVVAGSCEQAEVAAKVAFILGRTRGKDFLITHQFAAILVDEDGGWEAVGSWPEKLMQEPS